MARMAFGSYGEESIGRKKTIHFNANLNSEASWGTALCGKKIILGSSSECTNVPDYVTCKLCRSKLKGRTRVK